VFPSRSGAPGDSGAGAPAFLSGFSRALRGLSLRLAELPWWAWLVVLGVVVAVLLLRLQRADGAAAARAASADAMGDDGSERDGPAAG
jgi:hypothetical protein